MENERILQADVGATFVQGMISQCFHIFLQTSLMQRDINW